MIVRKTPSDEYYVIRRTAKKIWREWFLVKYHGTAKTGIVNIGSVNLPPEFIGKRVAFKVEVLDYENIGKTQEGRDVLEDIDGNLSDSASDINLNKISRRRKKDSN